MSAIAGICRLDGEPVGIGVLDSLRASIARRGPDRCALRDGGTFALVSAQFWTTPEAPLDRQPLVAPSGKVMVADCRLDYRDELAAALGIQSQSTADSHLIQLAYERWGERCLERLEGDFSFVVWDPREKRLFAAVDHAGVRPLYYASTDRFFAFASEIGALRALPGVDVRLNEIRVADYLTRLFEDKTSTFYKGIVKLPPASSLTVNSAGSGVSRYWAVDNLEELKLSTDAEYEEAFRGTFFAAVRSRCRTLQPVGSMLSGGLDSTAVSCVAARVANAPSIPVHTFSAIFPKITAPERATDDRAYIDVVLASGGFEPHLVAADTLGPLSAVMWHTDEPLLAPNLYMDCAVFQSTREAGVRTLLSGNDGDSTVSYGYEFLLQLARRGRLMKLVSESKAIARRLGSDRWMHLAWTLGIRPLVPETAAHTWRVCMRRNRGPFYDDALSVRPEFAQRMRMDERSRKLLALPRPGSPQQEHGRGLDSGLLSTALGMLDKTAAHNGIETRFPFFDKRLMTLCVSMPGSQKLRNGITRSIMRRALAGVIPPQVGARIRKGSLRESFKANLFEFDLPLIREVYSDGLRVLDPYIDTNVARRTFERYLTTPQRGGATALKVFQLTALAAWMRTSRVSN